MVGRTFAPVDEMVETAEAIANGDLTRRVPDANPTTELGRLGESLNRMLGNIEESVESEREARERMRVFVADASHELRTPLTAIAGYSELHRRGGLPMPEDEEKAWSRIESESRRMKNLVDDLLTLARFGQALPLHLSEVDIGDVVRNAASDHAVSDPERTVVVAVEGPVVVVGDEDRLHQVVSSLLSNVSVHTPPGTSVDVRARSVGDDVEIVVIDDGPGIPPDALDHVFDRFYRADPSRSRKSGGSGLGLAIVAAIVDSHGGTVTASIGERGGAAFTVVIPKVPVEGTDEGGSNAQETPSFVTARSKGGLSL
jgi:two-component system OmpR family sensor kinase